MPGAGYKIYSVLLGTETFHAFGVVLDFEKENCSSMAKRTQCTVSFLKENRLVPSEWLSREKNHTLVRKIANVSEGQKLAWVNALPKATFAYNVTPQKLLESSPYTLMLVDCLLSQMTLTPRFSASGNSMRKIGEESIHTSRKSEREKWKVSLNSLQIGDIVMMKNREASKLKPKWKGPFYIVKKGFNDAYVIQDLDEPEKWQVNYEDIKHHLLT